MGAGEKIWRREKSLIHLTSAERCAGTFGILRLQRSQRRIPVWFGRCEGTGRCRMEILSLEFESSPRFIQRDILPLDGLHQTAVRSLTPHSVRRPNAYCMNELARAWCRNSHCANPRNALSSIAYQPSPQLPDHQQGLNAPNLDVLRGEANAEAVFERLFVCPLAATCRPRSGQW